MNATTVKMLVEIGKEAEEKKWSCWSELEETEWGEKVRAVNWQTSLQWTSTDCVFPETKQGKKQRQWFSKGIMLVLSQWKKNHIFEKDQLSNQNVSFAIEQEKNAKVSSHSSSLFCSLM